MTIQTELYNIFGAIYEYGTAPTPTFENPTAAFDYNNAMDAARSARSISRESFGALQSIEVVAEALTGIKIDIAPLDSSRYPDLEDQP
jgi:hypothetical protein